MIQIISGTNRPGANTLKIAKLVHSMYQAQGTKAELLNLAEIPQEIFESTSYATKPQSFEPFSKAVVNSKGLVIVTPEYNGSFPGVLKYFIDMLEFPISFERRPVCFIGLAAGMWGALRSVEQLQAIFSYRNAYIYPEKIFMPGISNAWDSHGKLSNSDWVKRLEEQAKGFSEFANKFSACCSK